MKIGKLNIFIVVPVLAILTLILMNILADDPRDKYKEYICVKGDTTMFYYAHQLTFNPEETKDKTEYYGRAIGYVNGKTLITDFDYCVFRFEYEKEQHLKSLGKVK